MSGKFKNTTALLATVILMSAGCKHYAACPELEEGMASDEKNIAYDDSAAQVEKKVRVRKLTPVNPKPEEVKPEQKSEKAVEEKKDLTIPDTKVTDVDDVSVTYVVPAKTTPVVITDIDLKEMDAADENKKTKIIKPANETKIILPVKKEQKIIQSKQAVNTAPSVFYLAETVYFNNGGATVDSSYYKKLRQIVKEAKSHNGKIIVQGFASSRTKNTDIMSHKMANLKVSVERAENVAKLLAQYGMPKNRIVTEGLSDSRPVYREVMPEGERLNRRAEIYISY